MSKMQVCPKCGKENDCESNFCKICGTLLGNHEIEAANNMFGESGKAEASNSIENYDDKAEEEQNLEDYIDKAKTENDISDEGVDEGKEKNTEDYDGRAEKKNNVEIFDNKTETKRTAETKVGKKRKTIAIISVSAASVIVVAVVIIGFINGWFSFSRDRKGFNEETNKVVHFANMSFSIPYYYGGEEKWSSKEFKLFLLDKGIESKKGADDYLELQLASTPFKNISWEDLGIYGKNVIEEFIEADIEIQEQTEVELSGLPAIQYDFICKGEDVELVGRSIIAYDEENKMLTLAQIAQYRKNDYNYLPDFDRVIESAKAETFNEEYVQKIDVMNDVTLPEYYEKKIGGITYKIPSTYFTCDEFIVDDDVGEGVIFLRFDDLFEYFNSGKVFEKGFNQDDFLNEKVDFSLFEVYISKEPLMDFLTLEFYNMMGEREKGDLLKQMFSGSEYKGATVKDLKIGNMTAVEATYRMDGKKSGLNQDMLSSFAVGVDSSGKALLIFAFCTGDNQKEFDQIIRTAKASSNTSVFLEKKSEQVSSDFQSRMDFYEEFFDRYIAFIGDYDSAENYFTMLGDYANILSEYDDINKEMHDYDYSSLTTADFEYYMNVYVNIIDKMTKIE